jgi:hypothetical protein
LNSDISVIADSYFSEAGLLKVLLLLTIGLGVSAMGVRNADKAVAIGAIATITGFCFVLGYIAFYFG